MPYLPAHQAQLNAGTPVPGATRGSVDCGPRSTSVGIDKLTEGEKVPSVPEVRKRADTQGPQTTSILDAKRAVDSYRRPAKGRRPLRMILVSTVDGVRQAIGRGRMLQVAIDYRTFNRLMLRTGDPNFAGGHSVAVMGQRERRGKAFWLLYDSLDDQRRAGIPQGARWVPARAVVAAMEAFAGGGGKAQAGIFAGGQER